MTRTQLQEADDIVLAPLSNVGQRMRWAVLGGRAQIGDERLFASSALRAASNGLVCPYGCCAHGGTPAMFTLCGSMSSSAAAPQRWWGCEGLGPL